MTVSGNARVGTLRLDCRDRAPLLAPVNAFEHIGKDDQQYGCKQDHTRIGGREEKVGEQQGKYNTQSHSEHKNPDRRTGNTLVHSQPHLPSGVRPVSPGEALPSGRNWHHPNESANQCQVHPFSSNILWFKRRQATLHIRSAPLRRGNPDFPHPVVRSA